MKTMNMAFEVKADEKGAFSGYGAIFGNVDLGGDIVLPGAFTKSLAAYTKSGTQPALLWSHNDASPIGDWTSMEEDSKGLKVSGQLWLDDGLPDAQKAYRMMRGTGTKGLSIGYQTKISERNQKGERLLKEVDLYEVSAVTTPMNPKATITRVKSAAGIIDPATVERALMDELGFTAAEAKAFCKHGLRGVVADDNSGELAAIASSLNTLFRS